MSKQLPPHPSIEQLKKQAKDLRKAHQSGDAAAIKRLRAHLPRFSDVPDEELRHAGISLQDCQHVVAREHGFESWNWLRAVVEIDLEPLSHLRDREIQEFVREVDLRDLMTALRSAKDEAGKGDPCSDELKVKFLSNMSERVRGSIIEEMEVLGPVPLGEAEEVRRRVLLHAAQLASHGRLNWPNSGDATAARENIGGAGDEISPRLLELVGRPLEEMAVEEIAELWKELAIQSRRQGILSWEAIDQQAGSPFVQEAMRLAVDGTEPDLLRDILETRVDNALLSRQKMRGLMVVEALVAIRAGDNPRIIHHKLGAIYQSEPAAPEAGNWEVSAEELAARLREMPFAQLEFARIDALLTDMGNLVRRQGLEALRPLVEAADYPLLRRALEMVCDQVEMRPLVEELLGMHHQEVHQARERLWMVIEGVLALQAGKRPDEVERIAREATVQERE